MFLFDFYGKLVAKADASCGQVNVSTICSSTGTYKWEASRTGIKTDEWKLIPRTTGSILADSRGYLGSWIGALCPGLCQGNRSRPS